MKKAIYIFRIIKSPSGYIYHNIEEYADLKVFSEFKGLFGSRLNSLVQIKDTDSNNNPFILIASYNEKLVQAFVDGMAFIKNIDSVFITEDFQNVD